MLFCLRLLVGSSSSGLWKHCRANWRKPLINDVECGGILLYWLLYQKLFPYFSPFRIFRYLTFRTVFASLTALFIGLIVGPSVIRQLRDFQIGQYIREEGPAAHQKKAGTPTMGGVLITIAIIIPTLLWSDLTNKYVWIAVVSTLCFAAIGFADDYLKIVHHRNLGLTGRSKLAYQILVSVQVAELTIFCGAMVGASIGFLWYNAHPAEVFMGDVGSLALGGAIGTVAVIIKQELLLPFIGGVFVLEAISVILQVGSYKLRKKRIFKMAPLHHHFELLGWSESKI